MREILFRGKRIDNGEWVEGAFLNDRDGAFYICPAVSDISYGDSGNRRRIGCWYKVDPSTVGQYTGLKDKNGKRIWEGDILKWDNKEWGCDHLDIANWDYELFNMRRTDWEEWCEVIGKIHDNPEFLEKHDGLE